MPRKPATANSTRDDGAAGGAEPHDAPHGGGGADADDGAHDTSRRSLATAVVAGLVCGLIKIIFATVFARVAFDVAALRAQHLAVGINMFVCAAFVGGALTSALTSGPASLGAPNVVAALFTGAIAAKVAAHGSMAADDGAALGPTVVLAIVITSVLTARHDVCTETCKPLLSCLNARAVCCTPH